jgi:hypothetical protein
MSPTSYQTALPRVVLHILHLGVTRHHGQGGQWAWWSAFQEAERPLHLQAHAGIEDQHLLLELLQP